MKEWAVTLPISGTAYVMVNAETEDEAIDKALEIVTNDDIESWEAHRNIVEGNVVYAQRPWHAEARDEGEVEE